MDDLAEINASDLQRLLGLSRQDLSELVADKVIVRGSTARALSARAERVGILRASS